MTSFTTFYLSRIIDRRVYDSNGKYIGIVKDLLVDSNHTGEASHKPVVYGIKIKEKKTTAVYSFKSFLIDKIKGKLFITCKALDVLTEESIDKGILLAGVILDRQIVDIHGRKLVRVNDVRLVQLAVSTHVVAVDIGLQGLLRRIGIDRPVKLLFSLFKASIPAKFILWEDVEAVDYSNLNIKLSKSYAKLQTLHPSDLADIIEELGKKSRTDVFSSLDEEKAADVLEELETDAQVHIIESLPVEKVADVFEKMPADEVADILDALEEDKAELLLNEMEKDSSQEVRELYEYPENTVGSIMTTEVLTFPENLSVREVIDELRVKNPENEELYNLFVTGENEKLVASFSLRDLIMSNPEMKVGEIMKPDPVHLRDYQEIDDVAELISKYNMLGIPVVDDNDSLQGMVVIGDVVEDLINKRRTNR